MMGKRELAQIGRGGSLHCCVEVSACPYQMDFHYQMRLWQAKAVHDMTQASHTILKAD